MDFIIIALIIFSVVQSITKKGKKSQHNEKPSNAWKPNASDDWKYGDGGALEMERIVRERKPESPRGKGDFYASAPMQPIQPSKSERMEPRETSPQSMESMEGISTEGGRGYTHVKNRMQQIAGNELPEQDPQKATVKPSFVFDAKNMMHAVMMSEILARPAQRKWGKR